MIDILSLISSLLKLQTSVVLRSHHQMMPFSSVLCHLLPLGGVDNTQLPRMPQVLLHVVLPLHPRPSHGTAPLGHTLHHPPWHAVGGMRARRWEVKKLVISWRWVRSWSLRLCHILFLIYENLQNSTDATINMLIKIPIFCTISRDQWKHEKI